MQSVNTFRREKYSTSIKVCIDYYTIFKKKQWAIIVN